MSTNNMKNPYGVYEPEYKLDYINLEKILNEKSDEEKEENNIEKIIDILKDEIIAILNEKNHVPDIFPDIYISVIKGIARGISSLANEKKVPCEADVPNVVEKDYFQWSNIEDKYLETIKKYLEGKFADIKNDADKLTLSKPKTDTNADELTSLKKDDDIVSDFEKLKKSWENIVKQVHFCIWAQLYASSIEMIRSFYPKLTDKQKESTLWSGADDGIEHTLFVSCGKFRKSHNHNDTLLMSITKLISPVLKGNIKFDRNGNIVTDKKNNVNPDTISYWIEHFSDFTVDWSKFDENLIDKITLDFDEWKIFGSYDESIWRFAKDVKELYREVIFQPLERVQPEVPTIDEKLYALKGNELLDISNENLPKNNLATLTLATIVSAVKSDHSNVKKGKTNYALPLSHLKDMGLVSSDTKYVLIVDSGYDLVGDLHELFGEMVQKDIFPGEPYVYISGNAYNKFSNR